MAGLSIVVSGHGGGPAETDGNGRSGILEARSAEITSLILGGLRANTDPVAHRPEKRLNEGSLYVIDKASATSPDAGNLD